MPTVSESLAKLSASMAELSQRAKEAEDHIAAARKETHEQLETRVAEAKASAQRRREEIKTRGAKMNDQLASAWASLVAHVHEQFEKMRAKLGTTLTHRPPSGGLIGPRPTPPMRWTSPSMPSTKPRRRPLRLPTPGRSRMPKARAPHRRQVRSDVPDPPAASSSGGGGSGAVAPHRDLVVGSGETDHEGHLA